MKTIEPLNSQLISLLPTETMVGSKLRSYGFKKVIMIPWKSTLAERIKFMVFAGPPELTKIKLKKKLFMNLHDTWRP